MMKQRQEKGRSISNRQPHQVDHDILFWVLQKLENFLHFRPVLAASLRDRTFDRLVAPFGVDEQKLIFVPREPLQKTGGYVRLPASRRAGDQQAIPIGAYPDFRLAVGSA